MTLDAIRALLSHRPFEPMRVKTSSGQTFEIRHPEMAMLARSAIAIVHPDADGTPTDKVEYVSYLHISSVETMIGERAA
jgi:hypothetical protein